MSLRATATLRIFSTQKLRSFRCKSCSSTKTAIRCRSPLRRECLLSITRWSNSRFHCGLATKCSRVGSKYILRKASENSLPHDVVWRKDKIGFRAPEESWLENREHFFSVIYDSVFLRSFINFDDLSKEIDSTTLWKLYNVAGLGKTILGNILVGFAWSGWRLVHLRRDTLFTPEYGSGILPLLEVSIG